MKHSVSDSQKASRLVAFMPIYLQESVQGLQEQVHLLRSQRQRDVVLAHLPVLRIEAQHQGKTKASARCMALEMLQRLQQEPAQTPKVEAGSLVISVILYCLDSKN